MFSSVKVWPTGAHSFIPITVGVVPFKNLDRVAVLDRQAVEECVNCHRPLDRCSRDGDRFRCCWCQKQIKPVNVENAAAQCELSHFVIRESTGIEGRFNLVFALDACSSGLKYLSCVEYLATAIQALPEDQPFHLAVIQKNYITWVFVSDGSVVLFDTAHGPNVSKHLNLKRYTNYKQHLNIIHKYLTSVKPEADENHSVDSLIEQLVGESTLFSRIVLFGPRGPTRRETKMIFVDWVSPVDFTGAVTFDGYFLSEEAVGVANMQHQVVRLMHEIASWKPIFNVEITAYVTGYKLVNNKHEYAGAPRSMCQAFQVQPKVTSLCQLSFGVEVKYVRFADGCLFNETVWISRVFSKSSDFIPICTGLRPWVLICTLPHDRFAKFLRDLITHYTQNCTSTLAGKATETTFSTVPHCQIFLSYMYNRSRIGTLRLPRVFCDPKFYLGVYHPCVSFWTDFDTCLATNCCHDEFFYKLMGQPPIVVLDKVQSIVIFETNITNDPIPDTTSLGRFLALLTSERFPEPMVYRANIQDIYKSNIFDDKDEIIKYLSKLL